MGIENTKYALEIEFLDFRERGLYCRLFVEENVAKDGEKADWRLVDRTSPRPADPKLCLVLLADMARYHGIPEHEHIGLTVKLETKFQAWAEKNGKGSAPQTTTARPAACSRA